MIGLDKRSLETFTQSSCVLDIKTWAIDRRMPLVKPVKTIGPGSCCWKLSLRYDKTAELVRREYGWSHSDFGVRHLATDCTCMYVYIHVLCMYERIYVGMYVYNCT